MVQPLHQWPIVDKKYDDKAKILTTKLMEDFKRSGSKVTEEEVLSAVRHVIKEGALPIESVEGICLGHWALHP